MCQCDGWSCLSVQCVASASVVCPCGLRAGWASAPHPGWRQPKQRSLSYAADRASEASLLGLKHVDTPPCFWIQVLMLMRPGQFMGNSIHALNYISFLLFTNTIIYIYNNWTNFTPIVVEMLCRVTSSWVCCGVLLSATEHGCWLSTKQWQSWV